MTPEEMREEARNQQGDPAVLARRKSLRRQQGVDRLVATVPQAKVILTAGQQLAVAIDYDPATMPAPIVLIKGAGDAAAEIRRAAAKHGIPTVDLPSVVEHLYRQTGFQQPIS